MGGSMAQVWGQTLDNNVSRQWSGGPVLENNFRDSQPHESRLKSDQNCGVSNSPRRITSFVAVYGRGSENNPGDVLWGDVSFLHQLSITVLVWVARGCVAL